jgi:hypothetical protein
MYIINTIHLYINQYGCMLWLQSQWKKPPLANSEKRTNSASTFVKELDNPATNYREASSDYFALAPVNQLDEVVSQSMIP